MPYRRKNSKVYHYDFQIRGRRFHGSCETEDFEEAKAVEAEARVRAKDGLSTTGSSKPRFTVSQALGTYWKDVSQHQSSSATSGSMSRMILEHLDGGRLIDELTTADVVHLAARFRASVSDGTSNRRLDVLKRAVAHMGAVYDAQTPEIDWKRAKTPEPEERIRELSQDEERRLFAHLRSDLIPLVRFALMTGQRKAEICLLRWNQVDLENRRIRFKVKGGKTHSLPISRQMLALLSSLPRANTPQERAYVFTYLSKDGERYRIDETGGYIWSLWRQALEEAGIEDFRFHDLRHTFATRMLRQTGNLKLVSRLLGHTKVETTARYAHVLDDDLAAAMEAFSVASPDEIPDALLNTQRNNAES